MTSELVALCIDAQDPWGLSRFWADLLGMTLVGDEDAFMSDEMGFGLRFLPCDEPKRGPNQAHFDLTSSSLDHQRTTVARALSLGARHIDVGQRPEEGHVVLADPEGNEFCVIGPGNQFLAECGFFGALACDGSQEAGYFWSAALNWPLVWDQDEETAIRSPAGGPKLTWGGPPVAAKSGRNRMRFDLAAADGSMTAEVDRMVALGARVLRAAASTVAMADPDGNEFTLQDRALAAGLGNRGVLDQDPFAGFVW